MAKVGRPPVFESPEQMEEMIKDYWTFGITERTILCGKPPNQLPVKVAIPTITGLCLYLGFESRQSFYDYEEKPEYSYIIKKARLAIENIYEEHLIAGNTVGAIFALKNMNWSDKRETEHSGSVSITPITGMVIK